MALDNKYRVHEVAKDFGVSTKEITEILTKYRSAPKNHMQVLDDTCLLYTSPSPRDPKTSRMPSSA